MRDVLISQIVHPPPALSLLLADGSVLQEMNERGVLRSVFRHLDAEHGAGPILAIRLQIESLGLGVDLPAGKKQRFLRRLRVEQVDGPGPRIGRRRHWLKCLRLRPFRALVRSFEDELVDPVAEFWWNAVEEETGVERIRTSYWRHHGSEVLQVLKVKIARIDGNYCGQ